MARSIRLHDFGGPEMLRIEDVEVDAPGDGEVRIRIRAIGINRTELTLRSGRSPRKPALPTPIGFEAAGEIEAIGSSVSGFAIGDRVALLPTYGPAQYGIYSELSLAPANALVAIPESISFKDAAATWVAFGTAWAGLIGIGDLRKGQSVLLPAASSSVGLAAIQIANRLGATPIAITRTAEKVGVLRRHGAAAVVVSDVEDVVEAVKRHTDGNGADLVFDPIGGPAFAALSEATAAGGTLLLYGALAGSPAALPPFQVFGRDLTVRGVSLTQTTNDSGKISELKGFVNAGLADGSLKPVIARTFALDAIAEAHRFVEAGRHIGKVVVLP